MLKGVTMMQNVKHSNSTSLTQELMTIVISLLQLAILVMEALARNATIRWRLNQPLQLHLALEKDAQDSTMLVLDVTQQFQLQAVWNVILVTG